MQTSEAVWTYWLSDDMVADVVAANGSREQSAHVRPLPFSHKFDPLQVGCVVTRLNAETLDQTELLNDLARRHSPLTVVYLIEKPSARAIVAAMNRGAFEILDWPAERNQLVAAIDGALTASVEKERLLAEVRAAQERLGDLSPGESQVLHLMLSGQANKVVAKRLGVALRTVEARRSRVLEKMGTRNLVEIATLLNRAKLLGPAGLLPAVRHANHGDAGA